MHYQDAEIHEEQAAAEEAICKTLSISPCSNAHTMVVMPSHSQQNLLSRSAGYLGEY